MKIAEITGGEIQWAGDVDPEPSPEQTDAEEIARTVRRVRNASREPVITPAQWQAGQTLQLITLGQRLAGQMAQPQSDSDTA